MIIKPDDNKMDLRKICAFQIDTGFAIGMLMRFERIRARRSPVSIAMDYAEIILKG
jgi:hypothetical protein